MGSAPRDALLKRGLTFLDSFTRRAWLGMALLPQPFLPREHWPERPCLLTVPRGASPKDSSKWRGWWPAGSDSEMALVGEVGGEACGPARMATDLL